MSKQKKRALVISAHADDHLSCAGTLFKLRDQGFELFEIVLTDSGEGRDFRNEQNADVADLRAAELNAAQKFLGIKESFAMNQEDLGLTYSKELMLKMAGIIRQVKPSVGFIHNSYDSHPDHIAANKLGSEAFKWAASGVRPEMGGKWRTPIVLEAEGMLAVRPNVIVDVTDYAEKKKQLLNIYASQAKPGLRSFEDSILNLRGYLLKREGSTLAEAFTTDITSPIILFDNESRKDKTTN